MKDQKREKKYSGAHVKARVKYGMTNDNWRKLAGVFTTPVGLWALHHLFPLQMQTLGWLVLLALAIYMAPWGIRKLRHSKVEWKRLLK
ncbi:hypothetical protein Rhal01_02600 [Rubritalea halochordaticola]|uniref:Uncharacterized protein n=1 Tax=Rubritalea halochordaticola TaxID=714537 RepID=A0ABP9V719_9BACT